MDIFRKAGAPPARVEGKTMLANVDWTFAGSVIVSGLVVVFAVLILLWGIVAILGRILAAITGSGKGEKDKAENVASKAPAPAKPAGNAPMPIVEDGIGDEIVAVIAAAVAAMTGGKGVLRSVRRSGGKGQGRSPWMTAGLLQNTRPF